MATGVNILCYKSKTLANGEHPLMIRICKDGKKKYISLGVSVLPQFWDFEKNKPKRNCPNKIATEKLISTKTTEYNTLIIDMIADQKDYTPQSLAQTIGNKIQCRTVEEMYNKLIADMRNGGQLGNLAVYKYSRDSLLKYTRNRLDIPFRDIDCLWLKRYEEWLHNRGCKDTTISQLFRTLRSVFNKSIEQGVIKNDNYPFAKFKLSKFDLSTQKRAITKSDIQKILELDLSDSCFYMALAKDMFLFSYFGAGINFTDIALLKFANIKDGRIRYTRKKTGKSITFLLSEISNKIIEKYASPFWQVEDYIFPILHTNIHKTERQKRNRIHKALGNINKRLKEIGIMVEIDNLTTYVARHTFATVLKRSGVNVAIISESLGHSDLSTTQIYLDSFENSQIDEAMKNLV
ncbi:MAG: site-specific integrase [Alistipes sp.]|nr:site-specific integrase [Alistipes sp.]